MAPTIDAITLSSIAVALLAALSGSLHCVVMCGPIRLLSGNSHQARIFYQGGRLFGYLALGGAAGYFGKTIPIYLLLPILFFGIALAFVPTLSFSAWKSFRQKVLKLSAVNPFFLGLGSAILPCGLLHAWIAVAAISARPLVGSLVLGMLWLGTLPALELSAGIFQPLRNWRNKFPRAMAAAFLVIALLPMAWRYSALHSAPAEKAQGLESCPMHSHKGH